METMRTQDAFGTQSNSKVWVMQEFKNSSEITSACRFPKAA